MIKEISVIIVLIFVFSYAIIFIEGDVGWPTCKLHSIYDQDKYCQKIESNFTFDLGYYITGSHKADEARAMEYTRENEERAKVQQEYDRCYRAGHDINQSFDIIFDYNLTCTKLAYINDHLIDHTEQQDGGYIDGHYSGFFSHGNIDGKLYQYVTERVIATGQLVQHIQYHLDCKEQKTDESIDFYSTSEFVMYYVDRCIGK